MSIHTWRIGGIVFLWGVSQGILDPIFGYPAGIGDILIGVTAIPFAYFLRKGVRWARHASIVWNILGITDLILALSLGIYLSQQTMQTLPWILIPTVAVPILIIIHVITLYRLRLQK